ncbi:hypothetical protein GGR50DRAFT_640277 [Xylaria sp. CBS 124048]|nr:hypothetical protein GGR50DRAFT_640277 [Xylaria sp. CBS 124048]
MLQTVDVVMEDSPMSEATSAVISPGHSPVPLGVNKSRPSNSLDSNATMVDAQYISDILASRACEKCRSSKRKCDKKLPFCDRCKRLNVKCHYPPEPSVANPHNSSPNNGQVIFLQRSHPLESDVLFRGLEPLEGITASQILSLVTLDTCSGAQQPDYHHSITLYFNFIHPWYGVIHQILFFRQLQSTFGSADTRSPTDTDSSPLTQNGVDHAGGNQKSQTSNSASPELASKEFALLIVLMNLTIRMRYTDAGEQHMFNETYRTVKRMLSMLMMRCADGPVPSIELVQCGALMALYEYGHGEIETAYNTLSHTAVLTRVMGISTTQKGDSGIDDVPLTLQEEQRNCLWWGLFILEQFVLQDDSMRHLPFVFESPSRTTLLPEAQSIGPTKSGTHKAPNFSSPRPTLPTSRLITTDVEVGSLELGSFQLSAKTASIFHRALWIDKERRKRPNENPHVSAFTDLDTEIRMATKKLLVQSLDWETKLDCFAMLIGALFVLYTPFLSILEHSTPAAIERDTELTVALTALRFACKMSSEISCKINTDFDTASRSPAVLCAPAGASCYRVILAYACISRIFPEEHDACEKAIREKFESLWLFSFRWGFAEKMMRQLEYRAGIDRKYYLRNTSFAPPPRGLGYELSQ